MEFASFGAVVAAAAETVERNAQQIERARRDADGYRALIEHAMNVLAIAKTGASSTAEHAIALERDAREAQAASSRSRGDIEVAHLAPLVEAIERVSEATRAMAGGTRGLLEFVNGVDRISRQAALLSTNARIEAAHLGARGSGFGIVASEVSKLARSTKKSVQDVGLISRQLAESTERMRHATVSAHVSADALASDTALVSNGVTRVDSLVVSFAEAVESIATTAEEQQAFVPVMADAFQRIAQQAASTAARANEAAAIDLAGMYAQVRKLVGSYRLGDEKVPQTLFVRSALASAIVRVAQGETGALSDSGDPLGAAVNRFAEHFARAEREMLAGVMRIAVGVGRNSFIWKSIAASLDELKTSLSASRHALIESRDAATTLLQSARSMERISELLDADMREPAQALTSMVGSLGSVRSNVALVHDVVAEVGIALERAGTILELVDEISAETNLLALNAAIEAAHAGEAGLGFSVIAGEIRKLADRTHSATANVTSVMTDIAGYGERLREGADVATQRTHEVEERAQAADASVEGLLALVSRSVERAHNVARHADEQAKTFAALSNEVENTAASVDNSTAVATDIRRIELANVGRRAHDVAARRRLGTVAERLRPIGSRVAEEIDDAFSRAISSRAIRAADCTDTAYVELTGEGIRTLARLFDVSKVPPSGFNPPKFATRYDRAVEDLTNAAIDRWVPEDPSIKAMFAVDLNGYCFGHYKECRQDWTGDYATDLNHNRIKRFFEDPLSLRCSRVGLEGVDSLPARAPYEAFVRAGARLARTSERPWAIFTYARDTGIVYNDLSVALYALDRRVGTIRIIYDADAV